MDTILGHGDDGAKLAGFVYLRSFQRAMKRLFSEDDLRQIEQRLVDAPDSGAIIAGTGGLRKIRVALFGRGKSGGARVIYYFRSRFSRIYLITAYAKNEKENLTIAERNALKMLTARLDRERLP